MTLVTLKLATEDFEELRRLVRTRIEIYEFAIDSPHTEVTTLPHKKARLEHYKSLLIKLTPSEE